MRQVNSPVVTVILIAVAVALGVAIAVWAGAVTGNLKTNQTTTTATSTTLTENHWTLNSTGQYYYGVKLGSGVSYDGSILNVTSVFLNGTQSSQFNWAIWMMNDTQQPQLLYLPVTVFPAGVIPQVGHEVRANYIFTTLDGYNTAEWFLYNVGYVYEVNEP